MGEDARKQDTRRKIVLGAWVQYLLDTEGADSNVMRELAGRSFPGFLTRNEDRALFGLPPMAETP